MKPANMQPVLVFPVRPIENFYNPRPDFLDWVHKQDFTSTGKDLLLDDGGMVYASAKLLSAYAKEVIRDKDLIEFFEDILN